MFYHLDSIKKKLRFCDTIRAKAEAKNDPTIITINQIVGKYGLKWSYLGTGSSNDKVISASKALVSSYEELGPQMFEVVIRILVRTWDGQRESLSAAFIRGMSLFVREYVHEAKEDVFIKKMAGITPAEIKSLARAELSVSNNDLKYARVFLGRYNYRSGVAKLENRLDS